MGVEFYLVEEVATAIMKFSLALLFIFGFITFIGAAPAEDAADKKPAEPKQDEEVPEVPESSDDEEEKEEEEEEEDDAHAKLENTALVEAEQDEDEDPAEEENYLEVLKKKGRRCGKMGFRWTDYCRGKGKKRKCWICCTKCKFVSRCRRVRRYRRPVCFYYWKTYCKGHRHRHKMCLRAHYTCLYHGRCWSLYCHRVKRKVFKE